MKNLPNLVATFAAILVTGSWLPQVVKTWKTGRAQDFSWAWLAAFSIGVALWGVDGVLGGGRADREVGGAGAGDGGGGVVGDLRQWVAHG